MHSASCNLGCMTTSITSWPQAWHHGRILLQQSRSPVVHCQYAILFAAQELLPAARDAMRDCFILLEGQESGSWALLGSLVAESATFSLRLRKPIVASMARAAHPVPEPIYGKPSHVKALHLPTLVSFCVFFFGLGLPRSQRQDRLASALALVTDLAEQAAHRQNFVDPSPTATSWPCRDPAIASLCFFCK